LSRVDFVNRTARREDLNGHCLPTITPVMFSSALIKA
jgi:hypothetical protein